MSAFRSITFQACLRRYRFMLRSVDEHRAMRVPGEQERL